MWVPRGRGFAVGVPLTCFRIGWIVGILEKPFVKPEPGVGCRMGYVYGTVTPIFDRKY